MNKYLVTLIIVVVIGFILGLVARDLMLDLLLGGSMW